VKPLTISLANLLDEPQHKISSSATTGGHNVKKRSIA
jgi:hypothetical protein